MPEKRYAGTLIGAHVGVLVLNAGYRRDGPGMAFRQRSICNRCGGRFSVRKQRADFICVDCRASDPEYVKIVSTPTRGRPMARIPWGAKTLLEEVHDIKPETAYTETDLDGFEVNRTLVFDADTGPWLHEILQLGVDPRIESLHLYDDGTLAVTFVGGIEADNRDPFSLAGADGILNEQPEPEPEPAPKKTRQRRAAPASD